MLNYGNYNPLITKSINLHLKHYNMLNIVNYINLLKDYLKLYLLNQFPFYFNNNLITLSLKSNRLNKIENKVKSDSFTELMK